MTVTRAGVFGTIVYVIALALGQRAVIPVATAMITSAPATPVAGADVEMPNAAPVSLVIQNNGAAGDLLLGGETPLAERVALHQTRLTGGVRQMSDVVDGVTIPGNRTTVLEPGARHLMLIGLRGNLVQGGKFPLTLHFAHAGTIAVTVRVRRKVDAAGTTPFPPVVSGDLAISLASAPPVGLWATPESP